MGQLRVLHGYKEELELRIMVNSYVKVKNSHLGLLDCWKVSMIERLGRALGCFSGR